MSPRAAWRLRTLAFEQVYDYAGGKEDWLAWGLPGEGTLATVPKAADLARADVPTCRLDERLEQVRRRVGAAGWDNCLVVNEERVILGRIGERALRESGARTAEEAMSAGPGTVRPNEPLARLLERMRKRGLAAVPVTTPDGRLVGVLRREDAEAASHTSQAAGAPE
jgi:CBS domain-containing protein